MDEAEILSDNISVLRKGKLQCSGSLLYLMRKHGLGYKLRILLDDATVQDSMKTSDTNFNYEFTRKDVIGDNLESKVNSLSNGNSSSSPDIFFVVDRITNFLRLYIPETYLLKRWGREVAYRFPPNCEESLAELFSELSQALKQLKISSYGISNSNLYDVFSHLAEYADKDV